MPLSATLGARHAPLLQAVANTGLDALVVTSSANIRYLTGHAGSAGVLIMAHDGARLLVDGRYIEAVRTRQGTAQSCPDLIPRLVPGSYDEAIIETLLESGATRVGFEAAHVTVAQHAVWSAMVEARRPGLTLVPVEGLVEGLRLVKDDVEVEILREAARRLTPVAGAVLGAMQVGMSERVIAGLIEAELRTAGYERPAFDVIVASGPNAALPHHRAGDRPIAQGDMVVLDFGGVLDGYCSDLTRTVSVGEPSEELRRVYGAVLDAQQAAIHAIAPGVSTSDVDAAARDVLLECRLGDFFSHGTGHGLGLEIHEAPRLTRASAVVPAPLRAGMVTTVEPGAYVPGWGGVRIEDDVLVTATGYELLTNVPRHLLVVG